MRQKLPNHIRPEFRKILKEYRTCKALAEFLGVTQANLGMMKTRGYMSVPAAERAEIMTIGKYRARMLCKRGEL